MSPVSLAAVDINECYSTTNLAEEVGEKLPPVLLRKTDRRLGKTHGAMSVIPRPASFQCMS